MHPSVANCAAHASNPRLLLGQEACACTADGLKGDPACFQSSACVLVRGSSEVDAKRGVPGEP